MLYQKHRDFLYQKLGGGGESDAGNAILIIKTKSIEFKCKLEQYCVRNIYVYNSYNS